jgi:hypothetical protein
MRHSCKYLHPVVHRFKGTDSTFGEFPERMQHVLSETIRNIHVESVVFPAYEVLPSVIAIGSPVKSCFIPFRLRANWSVFPIIASTL